MYSANQRYAKRMVDAVRKLLDHICAKHDEISNVPMSLSVAPNLCCHCQEAKQLEEARLKLAKEQKKKQEMEAASRLAAQRKAAEQAARQLAEAELQQKKAERQQRVRQSFLAAMRTGACGTNWFAISSCLVSTARP